MNYVAGVIKDETKAKVGEDAKFFPFPSVAGSKDAVVAGGDMAVQFKDDKATTELMKFLASPESGEIWAGLGGFLSPLGLLLTAASIGSGPTGSRCWWSTSITSTSDAPKFSSLWRSPTAMSAPRRMPAAASMRPAPQPSSSAA